MSTFLQDTLKLIAGDRKSIPDDYVLVVPGKRPAQFVRKYLAEMQRGFQWSPKILSISEFVEEMTGKTCLTRTQILFEWYAMLLANAHDESFDEFFQWAPQALADFNDVENYMLDGERLFTDLRQIKEIEEWSFQLGELSLEQNKFNVFWQGLGDKYKSLRKHLLEKDLFYSGLLNRHLAESLTHYLSEYKSARICFVGFNALSTSERQIIQGICKNGRGEVYWDTDAYYQNDVLQEAGTFMRRHAKEDLGVFVDSSLSEQKNKEVFVHECASPVVQAKVAAGLTKAFSQDENTAYVLCDESYMSPLLHSIGKEGVRINVSMGYPLSQTAIYSLVKFLVYLEKKKLRNTGLGVYHEDLDQFLTHPYIQSYLMTIDAAWLGAFRTKIKVDNWTHITADRLSQLAPEINEVESLVTGLIEPSGSNTTFLSYVKDLLGVLALHLENQALEFEAIQSTLQAIRRVGELIKKHPFVNSLSSLEQVLFNELHQTSLSFLGEPLKGLQMMGLLETRSLDFDNVVLLGANEGHLPKPKQVSSYIPVDLRKYVQLPTYEEQDAIYAYYFYRLLNRSKKVHLFYSVQSDEFGSAEKSRYLTQIENELPDLGISVRKKVHSTALSHPGESYSTLQPGAGLEEDLIHVLTNGISPSAFNTFLRCPMDFYFKYVLGLKEVDAVEDKMEANTFGTIVHEVLEVLYKEVKGQLLSPKHIQAWLPRIETELKRAIVKHWGSGQVESGFNYIGKEVAREYIQRFLNWEKNELLELEKGGKTLRIIDLEQYLEGVIEVPVINSTIQVKLRGVVDRIDEVDGQVRIIDYKTGGVSPSDLKISPTLEELAENSKPKALQVLIYKYLFAQNHKANWSDVKAGVFSLKQMNNGMMFLQPTSKKIDPLEFQQSIEQNFTRSFEQILGMMLDPEAVWEHQEKSDFCAYCDS